MWAIPFLITPPKTAFLVKLMFLTNFLVTAEFSFTLNSNTSASDVYGLAAVATSGGIYTTARQNLPYAMPFDANGERIQNPGGDSTIRNVYDEHLFSQDQRVTLRAFGSFYAQIDLGSLSSVLDGLNERH